jgi:uncharacterized membrane protein YphA (DoxX/SURF4 family)
MKIAAVIVRTLLGLAFVVFGANAFHPFLPMPQEAPPAEAGAFAGALMSSGYIKAVAAFQVMGGLLLLTGRFTPLGLTLLGPVLVNILFFHTFLNTEGWQPGALFSAMALFLLYYYRGNFAGLLRGRIAPSTLCSPAETP